MIEQLDIFSIIPDRSSSNSTFELPKAKLLLDPKVEAALEELTELKQISNAQFQVGTRITCGDLCGEIVSVDKEMLCQVQFDGEAKPRPVFADLLELEPTKAALVEGAIVRSSLFFKGKTAKVLKIEQIHTITLATVELSLNGNLIKFPCGASSLEVVG